MRYLLGAAEDKDLPFRLQNPLQFLHDRLWVESVVPFLEVLGDIKILVPDILLLGHIVGRVGHDQINAIVWQGLQILEAAMHLIMFSSIEEQGLSS